MSSLTQSARLNSIAHDINANALAPGVVKCEHCDHVDTPFAKYENHPLGEKKQIEVEGFPFGRTATADDFCGMAGFLASQESNYMAVQTYVDGGQWMCYESA
jgi:galactitol 2-dehydrogenase